ncbi:MAG: polysaccharide pyruvyl transferase family protein [Cyanobacteria bacterium P01_A01_bin.135]
MEQSPQESPTPSHPPRYDRFRSWRDYLKRQPVVGYIGYLGYDNFGDELLFAAIARLFPQQMIAYDGATETVHRDPKYYLRKRLRAYRLLKPKLYNGVLLGGGTLINREAFLSRLQQAMRRYPTATFGTGVCEPQFWQRYHPAVDHVTLMQRWANTLRDISYLSVRGPHSAQTLQTYGLEAQMIGDPALSIGALRGSYRRTRRVAINVGSHGIQRGDQSTITQTVQRLCFALHRQGWWVEFLALNDIDWEAITQISSAMTEAFKRPFPCTQATGIGTTLAHIKTCDVLIGQRLHAVVAAHACGVPAIALSYAPKCDDYMASMGLDLFAMRTDSLTPTEPCVAELLARMTWLSDRYSDHCQQVRDKVTEYQRLQASAAQTITEKFT